MIETTILIVIGIAIGWCWPQPNWAKTAQARIVGWVKGRFS
jgi:hypothetical protein